MSVPCIFLAVYVGLAHGLSTKERSKAFIGYSETREGCVDEYSDCISRALNNGCIYDPYVLRRFCPISCNVDRCTQPGKFKVKHKGQASTTGTEAYAVSMEKALGVPPEHFRAISLAASDPKLTLSTLGMGTYLGDTDKKTDALVATAVIYSVTHGFNVIDTASNYRGGRGEVSIGAALDNLLSGNMAADFYSSITEKGDTAKAGVNAMSTAPAIHVRPDITRDMLFISTKAGFMPPRQIQNLIQAGSIMQGDVAGGQHCIHPTCLEASLKTSLNRMNLEKVDLLYLHNPAEVQLADVGKERFLKRLKAAFLYLESARVDGLLETYGLATWDCFRVPPEHPSYLSLEEVVGVAEQAGGSGHGFRYVQLPINVGMTEAVTLSTQSVAGYNMSTLDAAKTLRVGVFASGPLGEGDMLKRVTGKLDGVKELVAIRSTASKMLQYVRSVPDLITGIVGQKTKEYVESNCAVSLLPPLTEEEFQRASIDISRAVRG